MLNAHRYDDDRHTRSRMPVQMQVHIYVCVIYVFISCMCTYKVCHRYVDMHLHMLDITTKVYNDHQPRHRIDIIMNNYRKSLMLRVWAAPGASETIPEDPITTITQKTSHKNYHQKDVPEKLSPKRRPIQTITKKTSQQNYHPKDVPYKLSPTRRPRGTIWNGLWGTRGRPVPQKSMIVL